MSSRLLLALLQVSQVKLSTKPDQQISHQQTSDISKCTEVTVLLRFQKKVAIASCVCRTMLIRRALESPDPGASNGGSNFVFGHLGPIWCIIKSLEAPESQIPAIRIGAEKPILNQFSKKSCHSLARLSYDVNSTCAGKLRPWRVEWWVKLYFWTLWGRSGAL